MGFGITNTKLIEIVHTVVYYTFFLNQTLLFCTYTYYFYCSIHYNYYCTLQHLPLPFLSSPYTYSRDRTSSIDPNLSIVFGSFNCILSSSSDNNITTAFNLRLFLCLAFNSLSLEASNALLPLSSNMFVRAPPSAEGDRRSTINKMTINKMFKQKNEILVRVNSSCVRVQGTF